MKRFVLTAAWLLIAGLSLFFINTQKLQEKVQLWKNYNVVCVSKVYPESEILTICHEGGAEGVISRETSLFSVKNRKVPALKPYDNDGFTSETMRNFFFQDQTGSSFLLYVPEESITTVESALLKAGIPFSVDTSVEYPILCPILCFAAFIILMAVNRMPVTKALCLLPLVFVPYAVPFYSVAAAVLCILFVFCISDLYVKRNGALSVLLKKVPLWISLTAGMVSAAFSGATAVLLFFFGLAASAVLIIVRHYISVFSQKRCHFKSVFILPAQWIQAKKRYNLKTLLTMLTACTCFFILSLVSLTEGPVIKSQDLLLPSPSGYTESEGVTASSYAELLSMHTDGRNPDISDFLNEKWYAETAAYRKVREPFETAQPSEKVILPSFIERDGLIVEKDRAVFSFDDGYIASSVEGFAADDGIEKLLASEDGMFTTGYASSGKREISSLILPATALCAICFLLLAVVYCKKRHEK